MMKRVHLPLPTHSLERRMMKRVKRNLKKRNLKRKIENPSPPSKTLQSVVLTVESPILLKEVQESGTGRSVLVYIIVISPLYYHIL
jgi:hypothetical protein